MTTDTALFERICAAAHADDQGQRRLACAAALALAAELGVAPKAVGALCDEHDIRIVGCQLGCFR
jgi:hypothetical protein